MLGADVHQDLGLVVDHVDGTVFLCHQKMKGCGRTTAQSSFGTEFLCRFVAQTGGASLETPVVVLTLLCSRPGVCLLLGGPPCAWWRRREPPFKLRS